MRERQATDPDNFNRRARVSRVAGPFPCGGFVAGRSGSGYLALFAACGPGGAGDIEAWIDAALKDLANGVRIPFAVIDTRSDRVVGSTSYLDLSPQDRRIEIGWTWLDAPARRTPINTECKYLLLRHAFETLGCGRVQLKTDSRNLRSQTAIERLGAKREDVLRQHVVMPDGFVRDTAMYSIIASEWPTVKSRLESWLGRPNPKI